MEKENKITDVVPQEVIDVVAQDERRKNDPKKPFLVNEKGLTLSRVLIIGKGTYNTTWIDVNGKQVPLRLLSIEEEDELRYEVAKEMNDTKSIYSTLKLDPTLIERLYLCKAISKATTPNPDSGVAPFLKEKDIRALPNTSFATLLWHYRRIEKEYNPEVGDISEDEANLLISELLDSKKKSLIMDGLTFLQTRGILLKLLDIITEQEDSIGIFTSLKHLDDQSQNGK